MSRIFLLILLSSLLLTSCGRKGALIEPAEYNKHRFDHVIDEE